MRPLPFTKKDLTAAAALLKEKKLGILLFSEGTCQVEIAEKEGKKALWPFLQLDDQGNVIDCFCTCPAAEKRKSCIHLAAAYLRIFNDHPLPLHVRFRECLWNQLCQMASRRHGYDIKVLKADKDYQALSATGKRLFHVEGMTPVGKKRLRELLYQRPVETEETSLKFSNLPAEELTLWREGRPSHHLRYELSFWSDLAKWWMILQENKESYEIDFEGENEGFPKWINVRFKDVAFAFYIAEANWPQLIPSLATVDSPLPVHEFHQKKIEKISYDPARKELLLDFSPISSAVPEIKEEVRVEKSYPAGEWFYVPKKGFFPARSDPIFLQNVIPASKIAYVLQNHLPIVQKYLQETKIFPGSVKAQYFLSFDAGRRFHLQCYVFEAGDLQAPDSAYFGPWVYIGQKGFFLLDNILFEGVEKIIPYERVSDFLNRHRLWLNSYDGFQTHLSSLESHLIYQLSSDGMLRFETHLELAEEGVGEFVDFGDWLYVKGRGFYAKMQGRLGATLRPGTYITPIEIPQFIRTHREELEQVQGFFAKQCPLEKAVLDVTLSPEKKIVVRPQFYFLPRYNQNVVKIFGEYAFVEGEGFYEIPYEMRLPDAYCRERTIPHADEAYFVSYELDSLKPFIQSIDPSLRKPKDLFLRINQIKKDKKSKVAPWIIDLSYETEIGQTDVVTVWQALNENKRYLFSPAGLILLKQPRFNWLKGISKKRWLKGGKQLRLTTLEWIRLGVFDDVREPPISSPFYEQSCRFLEEFRNLHTDKEIVLEGFKSDLRAYQELGVRWLWFLYCHGLSGLLCDEMGLGKTHQAMGVISAVKNISSDSTAKFLVVCPTSVIYHWEELLKRFLPSVRVSVFYGVGRTLEDFETSADLLLTSYGTLRSEKKAIADITFDIAVFDEIQIAKNTHSQTHKALRTVDAKMRLGLTGTPIENRLLELKALFDVVIPTYMPHEAQFKELFVNPIEKNQDEEKKALLMRLTRPFILRRKKSAVLLELPEKIEEISYCALSEEQKELYKQTFTLHREALLKTLEDQAKPVPFLHIFSLLSTLKQICDHPCLITKQLEDFQKHKSGKWDLFIELLEETRDSGQKLVVFSQYLDMLSMMETYLKEHKIGYAHIRGSTRNRKEQLDKFRDDPQCEIFLASLQAVGVGVDLVSASVVIHYDRWWNPARENQATDRVHRIGQNRGVQVFKMVTKGTIEEHIHRIIEKKLELLEGVIGFDDKDHIKGLDRDELLQLLKMVNQDLN